MSYAHLTEQERYVISHLKIEEFSLCPKPTCFAGGIVQLCLWRENNSLKIRISKHEIRNNDQNPKVPMTKTVACYCIGRKYLFGTFGHLTI